MINQWLDLAAAGVFLLSSGLRHIQCSLVVIIVAPIGWTSSFLQLIKEFFLITTINHQILPKLMNLI